MKYAIIVNYKTLENLPKLGYLVWKYTIWQPWFTANADVCYRFLGNAYLPYIR
jgi:hypothetical protein